jgi:hypothetical protein
VRIAVESGTPLVPVYHFGNSKLFRWGDLVMTDGDTVDPGVVAIGARHVRKLDTVMQWSGSDPRLTHRARVVGRL